MKTYFRLIEEYPNSEKIGTLFYIKDGTNVTKVDSRLDDVLDMSNLLNFGHLSTKYFEKYFKISKDGYSIYHGDLVYMFNNLNEMSAITFDINENYSKLSLIFKTEINCDRFRENVIRQSLPHSWEECKISDGWYIDNTSEIKHWTSRRNKKAEPFVSKHSFVTKYEAIAQQNFAQLTQIAQKLNDSWEPDWNDDHQYKFVIMRKSDKLVKEVVTDLYQAICFKSSYLRDYAYETFGDLFKQYYHLSN